jgi:hypothetical protein
MTAAVVRSSGRFGVKNTIDLAARAHWGVLCSGCSGDPIGMIATLPALAMPGTCRFRQLWSVEDYRTREEFVPHCSESCRRTL